MMAREHNASSLEVAPDDDLRVTEVASDLLSVTMATEFERLCVGERLT